MAVEWLRPWISLSIHAASCYVGSHGSCFQKSRGTQPRLPSATSPKACEVDGGSFYIMLVQDWRSNISLQLLCSSRERTIEQLPVPPIFRFLSREGSILGALLSQRRRVAFSESIKHIKRIQQATVLVVVVLLLSKDGLAQILQPRKNQQDIINRKLARVR